MNIELCNAMRLVIDAAVDNIAAYTFPNTEERENLIQAIKLLEQFLAEENTA